MKILLLCTFERTGGAAVAANRLMKALRKHGIDAKMLVRDKQTNDENVVSIDTSPWKRKISFIRFTFERLVIFICNRFNRKDLFAVSIANTGTNVGEHPMVKDADIVHLHWINQGFLSLSDIRRLLNTGKLIVWTMHDMWPCTGICHHARECIGYQTECGKCFYLDSSSQSDLSHSVFLKKKKLFENGRITFTCCSDWMTKKADISALTREKPIFSISNTIDASVFTQREKKKARERSGLPQDKHLLLFGAVNVTDKRKGMDYLVEGLKWMKHNFKDIYNNLELVVFGQLKTEIISFFDLPVHPMNFLKDEEKIVDLYNAADLFVTPSLEENLPNTIMEAMSCGTPCVGFHVGGIPEMIDHKQNGYVAEYRNTEDLATGIEWVLKNREKLDLSAACIKKVHANYSESIVVGKYIRIYSDLLQRNGKIF